MLRTINFMGVRNIAFGVTLFLTALALFSWATKGLNYGLDFTGGTLIELTYERPADVTKVREQLASSGYADAIVQSFGATTDLLVRMPGEDPQLGHQVAEALQKAGGDNPAQVKRVEFVGPQVGEELRDQGGLGMLLALGGVMLYLAFRFQWKFAVGAIISLIHDVIVTVGILSFFQITFDLTVLAAVLAIIGYSLNDTIVVFDRCVKTSECCARRPWSRTSTSRPPRPCCGPWRRRSPPCWRLSRCWCLVATTCSVSPSRCSSV